MALRNASNTVSTTIPNLPRTRATSRIKECNFKSSKKSGKPMLQFIFELLSPATVEVDGQTSILQGVEMTTYLMLVEPTQENTRNNLSILVRPGGLMEKLGLVPEIDDENPNTAQFVGIVFDHTIYSRQRNKQTKDPATGEYKDLIDSVTNKPVPAGYELVFDVEEVIGKTAE